MAGRPPLEAYGTIGLDFTGSAVGTITVSTRGAYRSQIEVTGETGAITSESGPSVDSDVDVLLWHAGRIAERKTVSNANCYTLMLDSFSDWVQGRGEYRATGADGLHNQQVLVAAYASWHTGERQTLPAANLPPEPR